MVSISRIWRVASRFSLLSVSMCSSSSCIFSSILPDSFVASSNLDWRTSICFLDCSESFSSFSSRCCRSSTAEAVSALASDSAPLRPPVSRRAIAARADTGAPPRVERVRAWPPGAPDVEDRWELLREGEGLGDVLFSELETRPTPPEGGFFGPVVDMVAVRSLSTLSTVSDV